MFDVEQKSRGGSPTAVTRPGQREPARQAKGVFPMRRRLTLALILGMIVLPGLFAATAYANAGPPKSVEDGDAVFFLPVKHEFIQIVSEDLVYDIKVSGEEEAYADIIATYAMHNTSNEDVSTMVAFVANNPSTKAQIRVDGKDVDVLGSETMPWNITGKEVYVGDLLARHWDNVGSWVEYGVWEPTFEEILRFAGTGERTRDTNAGYDLEMSLFQLDFAAGSTRTLEVAYSEKAAVIKDRKGYSYVNPTAEFYYFLEPARYWKDFADLTVTIHVPRQISIESSLDGFQRQGDTYVAHFDELPSQNLRILAALDPTTIGDVVKSALPWACAGLAVGLLLRRRLGRRRTAL